MIFTLSSLKETAERRLPGYLKEALSIGRSLDNDRYEFTSAQMSALMKYRKPIGIGDVVKSIIHTAVDISPLTPATKDRIKQCTQCAKRAAALNAMLPNIPFISKDN